KKIVGVINAGNIPAVGFHDFMCVLLSGNIYHGKNSSDDVHLLPFIAALLKKIKQGFEEKIFFVERISNPDAVIATGSNNSARYFEYYFGKYPHIIRKNRNGVAVLDGNETAEELSTLADDVFQYFGLGCRSVSKIFVPKNFDVRKLFPVFEKYNSVSQHNRYMNNYNYQRVMLLMNNAPFLENGFVILREATSLHSPISVLHYERYKNIIEVFEKLSAQSEEVQCIACRKELLQQFKPEKLSVVPLGQTQNPKLWNYADGVDTMEFLARMQNDE
ncbi:MAG TPA: acyl-CoA reductase, partial [Bacteroidia bacterium]|nr:acyl-CoA reductase [Bacteroidia bacterium]